jgi:hypothetical protein
VLRRSPRPGAPIAWLPPVSVVIVTAALVSVLTAAPLLLAGPAAAGQPPGQPPGQALGQAAQSRQEQPAASAGGLQVSMSGAALAAAAARCAAWATDAGFANNGYMAGSLTTAVTVALAESGCDPAACYDNTTARSCREQSQKPGDSVDRGAWQLNSRVTSAVPNSCAYSGPCAARAAYYPVSQDGTYFARWLTYGTDDYAHYLWPAQRAVNALRGGTVASAMTGSCAGYPDDAAGGLARLENCGSSRGEIWRLAGLTLRTSAGLCLSATSRDASAPVEVARCDRGALQQWRQTAGAQLYNPGSRRCLTDPGSAVKPGAVLVTARCTAHQNDAWFKP